MKPKDHLNLFVIGAPKCGTTMVHSILGQFPDVCMSLVKEPGFFDRETSYTKGIEWYERTFFGHYSGQRWSGEATPWTVYSSKARDRVLEFSPEARFIVCLRDPAARAVSMYFDQVSAGMESRSPEEALAIGSDRVRRVESDYLFTSQYAQHLAPWLEAVPIGRFLVLTEQELADANLVAMGIGKFLGVTTPSNLEDLSVNSASEPRSRSLIQTLRRLEASEGRSIRSLRRLMPDTMVRRLGQAVVKMNSRTRTQSASVSPSVAEMLRNYFADDVIKTQSLLGRDLSHWPSHPSHLGQ